MNEVKALCFERGMNGEPDFRILSESQDVNEQFLDVAKLAQSICREFDGEHIFFEEVMDYAAAKKWRDDRYAKWLKFCA